MVFSRCPPFLLHLRRFYRKIPLIRSVGENPIHFCDGRKPPTMADAILSECFTYDGSTGRKCWATARERNRMRARYAIRQRVFGTGSNVMKEQLDGSSLPPDDARYNEKIQEVLRRIVRGDTSYFSILFMEENFATLNEAFPVSLLWENCKGSALLEYQRLCSRLGRDGVVLLETYVRALETCTVLEYAVWLKRYRIVRQLILGGVDLTIRGGFRSRDLSDPPFQTDGKSMGTMVQKYFFATFVPLSLSCYIVCRVVELRRSCWVQRQTMNPCITPVYAKCDVCRQEMDENLLLILLASSCSNNICPFRHQFCETCLWMDIVEHLQYRQNDVVSCPVCGTDSMNDTVVPGGDVSHHLWNNLSSSASKSKIRDRYEESLRRYNALPLDSSTVKQSGHKKKHIPEYEMIYSTWSDAVQPSLGRTQTARRDKFLHSAERSSFHFVKGCLEAGVDVNVQNEYGQTALLIAVWLNNVPLVQLLLDYGANPSIQANGMVSCWCLAVKNNQEEVLELLQRVGANDDGTIPLLSTIPVNCALQSSSASLSLLIDWSANHPGAGSFILDGCFMGNFLASLIVLWSSLPLEESAKKKAGPCSERSYYCDAYGTVAVALSSALTSAAANHDLPFEVVTCGPQMRFLSYSESGAVLAPHIDLSRTDPLTEARSTHSFLLYLTTCAQGGETALIGDVTGEGRNIVLATISPKIGRLLVFPHRCPHEGLVVVDTPKVLIRGELWLRLKNG